MPGQVNIVVKDEAGNVLRAGEDVESIRKWIKDNHSQKSETADKLGKITVIVKGKY